MRLRYKLLITGILIYLGLVCLLNLAPQNQPISFMSRLETNIGCENLSLSSTSFCLRDYVKPHFKYVVRSDINRTWEDIKTNGGDCYDYSRMYQLSLKELGFKNVELIALPVNETTIEVSPGEYDTSRYFHVYTRVYDETGYCILDQLDVTCFAYGTLLD